MNKRWEDEKKARIASRPKNEITATLENWVYDKKHNIYWGHVYGDVRKRFDPGSWIHTSYVEKTEQGEDGVTLVYTLNSIYRLGKREKQDKNLDI